MEYFKKRFILEKQFVWNTIILFLTVSLLVCSIIHSLILHLGKDPYDGIFDSIFQNAVLGIWLLLLFLHFVNIFLLIYTTIRGRWKLLMVSILVVFTSLVLMLSSAFVYGSYWFMIV